MNGFIFIETLFKGLKLNDFTASINFAQFQARGKVYFL